MIPPPIIFPPQPWPPHSCEPSPEEQERRKAECLAERAELRMILTDARSGDPKRQAKALSEARKCVKQRRNKILGGIAFVVTGVALCVPLGRDIVGLTDVMHPQNFSYAMVTLQYVSALIGVASAIFGSSFSIDNACNRTPAKLLKCVEHSIVTVRSQPQQASTTIAKPKNPQDNLG